MPRLAAHLPDAAVGLAPARGDRIHLAAESRPHLAHFGQGQLAAAEDVEAVEQRAVHVELELAACSVAHAHRRRRAVALQVIERALRQIALATQAIQDLQLARLAAQRRLAGPLHEAAHVLRMAGVEEGVGGEARIADPGVPVVPVAHAANLLG